MNLVYLGVLGLCLGSFVNALVWRVHEQSKGKKLSIAQGRSMCPHCRHALAWYDLVPVLSWLSLKGRCRYCKRAISWQYPLVELATAGLFLLSYAFWPQELQAAGLGEWIHFAAWLIIVVGFMALLVYDLRWMLLPNRVIYPLIAVGIVMALISLLLAEDAGTAAYHVMFSVLIGGGLFFLLFHISDGKWIGGGDVKLGALAGLVLGDPYLAFLMLLTASMLGTLVALPALFTKRLKATSRIPFGPFLIIATIAVTLYGQSLIDWYKASLGL